MIGNYALVKRRGILRVYLRAMVVSRAEVTELLQQWSVGRQDALEQLLPAIYGELKRLAGSYLRRERPDHTLQATALVHEAFLKLVDQRDVRWQNRAHFFGIAAQIMRRILVDHARAHTASKRGSGERPLSLDEALAIAPAPDVDRAGPRRGADPGSRRWIRSKAGWWNCGSSAD